MASCRACLMTSENMIPFDDLFVTNYNFLTNLNVSFNDGLSQFSCTNCWEAIKYFMEFRSKCIATEKKIKNVVSNALNFDIDPNINIPSKYCDDTKEENEHKQYFLNSLFCESDIISEDITTEPKRNGKKIKTQLSKTNHLELLELLCGICKMTFLQQEELNVHLENHKNDKECQICKETFCDWPEILSHRLVHISMHKGRCHLCLKYYKSQIALEYHYRKMHNDGNSSNLKCRQCARGYETPVKLKKHVQNVHSNKIFICDFCSKSFNNKQKLKVHVLAHTSYKKYSCDTCEYSSKYSSGLKEHKIRKHSLMKVSCKICTRVFQNQQKLDDHICICEKKLCPVCGKKINTSTRMTRHLDTHKNEKRYKCDRCPASYKCKTALQVHRDRHDGRRTKHCEFCPAKFYSATVLLKHRRIHTAVFNEMGSKTFTTNQTAHRTAPV